MNEGEPLLLSYRDEYDLRIKDKTLSAQDLVNGFQNRDVCVVVDMAAGYFTIVDVDEVEVWSRVPKGSLPVIEIKTGEPFWFWRKGRNSRSFDEWELRPRKNESI